MKTWIAIAVGSVPVVAIVAFLLLGADRFWRSGGDPDLGNVSFETLQRRSTPNDALACPSALCQARSDLTTALYGISARDLRTAFAKVVASEPRVSLVASDDATLTNRYIQRSRWLGFPDTVVARFFDRPGGQSTLALYSRSKFGEGDLGVNHARIRRWIAGLATIIRPLDSNTPDLKTP